MSNKFSTQAQRDISYHVHPQTNMRQHEKVGPMVIEKGDGVYVIDEHGHRYLEGMSGLWCASLGFSQPRLADAAYKQLNKLPYQHTFAHRSHGPVVELSEELVKHAPPGLDKVILQTSGSEAVDTAVKLVRYYHSAIGKPQKIRMIARERSYHGTTLAAANLSGLSGMHKGWGESLLDVIHVRCPHLYQEGLPGETEEQFSTRLATELEQTILEKGPDTVGAFIAEPVMGSGGVIVPPTGYFPKIQEVLRKYDILMIADEVICGFGRTGCYWGSETEHIKPDMMTCAKALSAAFLPISALIVSDRIYQAIAHQSNELGGFGHGYTYSGHPVAAAVALEALRMYDELGIVDHVKRVSPAFLEGLQKLKDHPLVGEVRGIGLVAALEFVADKETRKHFPPELKVAQRVNEAVQKHGVLLRALGADILAMCPPLIIGSDDLQKIIDALSKSLDEVYADLQSEK